MGEAAPILCTSQDLNDCANRANSFMQRIYFTKQFYLFSESGIFQSKFAQSPAGSSRAWDRASRTPQIIRWFTEYSNTGIMSFVKKIKDNSFNKDLFTIYTACQSGDIAFAKHIARRYPSRARPKRKYRSACGPGWIYTSIQNILNRYEAHLYNEFNILSAYEDDPFWREKSAEEKVQTAASLALRDATNTELLLRYACMQQIAHDFEIENPSGTVKDTLYQLIDHDCSRKLARLFAIAQQRELNPELYHTFFLPNGILRSFRNKKGVQSTHALSGTDEQMQQRIVLLNTLLSQDCSDYEYTAFAFAANQALAGDPFYQSVLTYKPDKTLNTFFANRIIAHQIEKVRHTKKKQPATQKNNSGGGGPDKDPNDEDGHKKIIIGAGTAVVVKEACDLVVEGGEAVIPEVETLAAEAEALITNVEATFSAKLADALNTGKEAIGRFALNTYHTLHGHLNVATGAPKGCHSIHGQCCFDIKIAKDFGNQLEKIAKIFYEGAEKISSLFPPHWSQQRILEQLIKWLNNGTFTNAAKFLESTKPYSLQLQTHCCQRIIEFRVDRLRGVVESVYPKIKTLLEMAESGTLNCSCMD